MTIPDVSLSPELMMSNLEFLAQLKLHDLILCEEKTGKIELENRSFLKLRAPGFHLETIEKTLLSSLSYVTKVPYSDEAIKIYNIWEKTKAGVEILRDTFLYSHDLAKAESLKLMLTKVNTMSKDVLSEKSKTAKIAKQRKDESPIPQPPPPPSKKETKTILIKLKVIRISNISEEFERMTITPDLLKVELRKTPERERKAFSSGDNILVEAFQLYEQRKASRENPQKQEILDFDQNGYWVTSDEGEVKS